VDVCFTQLRLKDANVIREQWVETFSRDSHQYFESTDVASGGGD